MSFAAFGTAMLLMSLGAQYKLATARGVVEPVGPESALQYVRANVVRGGKDLCVSLSAYLLLSDRNVQSHAIRFPPDHTPAQFREAIQELSTDHSRVVLLEISFTENYSLLWPNTPIEVMAAKDPVTEYIFAHYRPCSAPPSNGFWHFVFMVRHDSACPLTSKLSGGQPRTRQLSDVTKKRRATATDS